MKRYNNLYAQICSLENLALADSLARKGKAHQYGVRLHDRNKDANLQALRVNLLNKTYDTSPYSIFEVFEPKRREVYRLPYYPDRIVHHAIMNIMEPIWTPTFTADTYSCIKGRGIHGAKRNVEQALTDRPGTQYCLKLDIKKFYPSIDHAILKQVIRRKIKDADLLWLIDEIIDSADGVPIGNYLSQHFANLYLTTFDHWLKEAKQVKYYFRYSDDIVILADSKPYLHQLLSDIRTYLSDNLKLEVKGNYQVFPVGARGIDFVGYRFYHTHTLVRKSTKKRFARMVRRRYNPKSVASYMGWLAHCNSKNLLKKLLPHEHHTQLRRPRNRARGSTIQRRQDLNHQHYRQKDKSTSVQD